MKLGLKGKMTLGGILVVVFSMLISTLIITWTAKRQNQDEEDRALKQAFLVIRDDFHSRENMLFEKSAQIAERKDLGTLLKYFGQSKTDPTIMSTLENQCMELAKVLNEHLKMNHLWKIAAYDKEGTLMAFSMEEGGQLLVGYTYRVPKKTIYKVATIEEGEKISDREFEKLESFEKIATRLNYGAPERRSVQFRAGKKRLFLSASTPVLATDYVEKDGETLDLHIPTGFIVLERSVDSELLGRLAKLTGTEINLFLGERFAAGSKIEYAIANSELSARLAREGNAKDGLGSQVLKGQKEIGDEVFAEGAISIFEGKKPVGMLSSLRAKSISRKNTFHTIGLLTLVSLICILVVFPFTLFFARSITSPISIAVTELGEGSEQVAAAAEEISNASQSVAEGSSQQASSLEETTSALEEISGMIKNNAGNAKEADALTKGSRENLQNANKSMKALISSLEETSSASNDVAKIVKTIDEIAFQTNLLALNAAVEAARAGEAGSGFAVVADEVRNLAQRSAEASMNTQELIGDIIQKIETGAVLVKETDDFYRDVAVSVQKVSDLIGDIAGESEEQARGIEQISHAVDEVDKVVQAAAANAEESASASEQMSAQAGQMKEAVANLAGIVGIASGAGNQRERTYSLEDKGVISHPSTFTENGGQ